MNGLALNTKNRIAARQIGAAAPQSIPIRFAATLFQHEQFYNPRLPFDDLQRQQIPLLHLQSCLLAILYHLEKVCRRIEPHETMLSEFAVGV